MKVDLTATDLALAQRILAHLDRISAEGNGELTSTEIEVVVSGNRLKMGYGESGDPAVIDVWMAQS